jgi:hypothetical protein
MASEKKDQVVLVTSDDERYTVERKVAERSNLIKSMIEGESVRRMERKDMHPHLDVFLRVLSVATLVMETINADPQTFPDLRRRTFPFPTSRRRF